MWLLLIPILLIPFIPFRSERKILTINPKKAEIPNWNKIIQFSLGTAPPDSFWSNLALGETEADLKFYDLHKNTARTFLLCLSLVPPQHTQSSQGHHPGIICIPSSAPTLSLCCVEVHVGSCHSERAVGMQTPAWLQHRNSTPQQRKDSLQKSLGLGLFMLQHSNKWSSWVFILLQGNSCWYL